MGNRKVDLFRVVYWLIIFSTVVVFISIYVSNESDESGIYKDYSVNTLTNGWVIADDSGYTKAVSIPANINVDKDDIVRITRKLEETHDGDALCLRTENAGVRVVIGRDIVYEYAWSNENRLMKQAPGIKWNVIDLKDEYVGQTIMVNIKSDYDLYSGKIPSIYYGSKDNIHLMILKETEVPFFFSCIPFVLGIALILLHPFAKKTISANAFISIGMFLLIIGLWEICESGYLQFGVKRVDDVQTISYLSFAVLPLTIIFMLRTFVMIEKNMTKLIVGNITVFALYIATQFVGLGDFQSNIQMMHITVIVDIVYLYVCARNYFAKVEEKNKLIALTMAFVAISVVIGIDFYTYYVHPLKTNGILIRYSTIVMVAILGIIAISTALEVQKTNIQQKAIVNMAYTDNLTGIGNRRAFEEDVERFVEAKKHFTVVAIDMNNLKKINDELGHKYGDEALINVANTLRKFEEYGEKCYRMGGDEFEVICTNLNNEQIENVCKEINEELSKYEYFPGVPLAMAYGYFRYNANIDKEINKVLAQADRKMYEKKARMKAMGYATRD